MPSATQFDDGHLEPHVRLMHTYIFKGSSIKCVTGLGAFIIKYIVKNIVNNIFSHAASIGLVKYTEFETEISAPYLSIFEVIKYQLQIP